MDMHGDIPISIFTNTKLQGDTVLGPEVPDSAFHVRTCLSPLLKT